MTTLTLVARVSCFLLLLMQGQPNYWLICACVRQISINIGVVTPWQDMIYSWISPTVPRDCVCSELWMSAPNCCWGIRNQNRTGTFKLVKNKFFQAPMVDKVSPGQILRSWDIPPTDDRKVQHCDSVTQWLSDSVTQWLSESIFKWLSDSVTRWISESVSQWLSDSLTPWLIDSLTHLLSDSVT